MDEINFHCLNLKLERSRYLKQVYAWCQDGLIKLLPKMIAMHYCFQNSLSNRVRKSCFVQ